MKDFSKPVISLIALCLVILSITAAYAEPEKADTPSPSTTQKAPSGMRVEIFSFEISKGIISHAPSENAKIETSSGRTQLQLLVHSPQKTIVNAEPFVSEALQLVDDQGTDLWKKTRENAIDSNTGGAFPTLNSAIYDHGHQCLLSIWLHGCTPTAKTCELRLNTNLILYCAKSPAVTEKINWTLSEDKTLNLDANPLSMSTIPPPHFPPVVAFNGKLIKPDPSQQTFVTLTSQVPTNFIKSIRFFGPEGKEIPHGFAGQMLPANHPSLPKNSGENNLSPLLPCSNSYITSYMLNQKDVDKLTVKITYYKDMETVILPVDLKFGLKL